ncbi:myb, DNA-binding protein [Grosmannia clavigera kw1407]|uniref:Myb, DNA-binding protein n=1 Tax=Grosmannia clavigera (strain kw1407 / UAMH 11150) TaxID=655863 RepID=F0XJL9_GROCL|nr:myb, DNA-binding protein [Grosmannia clavigera kw1407]EFX02173.1 myb, DNA-binding protein [Grosmannia clavigera kw1407]
MPRLSRTPSNSSNTYSQTPQSAMSYYHHSRVPSISGSYYEQQLPDNSAGPSAFQDPFAVSLPLTMPPATMGMGTATLAGGTPGGSGGNRGSGTMSSFPLHHPRSSSGAWSPQDDDALLQARARGENWAQIHTQFQGKTANACRKRHERLMERRNADDFDTRKMENIAREYMTMRREIWQGLAQRTGEKWTTVEQKCLASGLKNLQSASRSAHRRERLESGYAMGGGGGGHGYEDESGGSGGGMSPSDDVDVEAMGSSPGGSVTGSGNRSVASNSSGSGRSLQPLHHGLQLQQAQPRRHQHSSSVGAQPQPLHHHRMHQQPHIHAPPPPHVTMAPAVQDVGSPGAYQDYYSTQAGFSNSLRSMGVAHAPHQQHHQSHHPHQQQQHHQQHHQGVSQYVTHGFSGGDRISAADMGIASLLDRGSSRGPLQ